MFRLACLAGVAILILPTAAAGFNYSVYSNDVRVNLQGESGHPIDDPYFGVVPEPIKQIVLMLPGQSPNRGGSHYCIHSHADVGGGADPAVWFFWVCRKNVSDPETDGSGHQWYCYDVWLAENAGAPGTQDIRFCPMWTPESPPRLKNCYYIGTEFISYRSPEC